MSHYSERHEAQLRAKSDAELQQSIEELTRRAQNHIDNDRPMLAAAAGRGADRAKRIKAEREAEERTRIGNTPTCDECGEQHSQDLTCEESAEMSDCDPACDEWPTCKHCGSNLADDDDVEAEVCDACQRDPYRWKTRTATA